MKVVKKWIALLCIAGCLLHTGSCKKCTVCTAKDTTTGEVKFREESCSKGPLLDTWINEIKKAYPAPHYDTECK